VGLAGESGSGKSVTADLLAKLDTPTAGTICFRGIDITTGLPDHLEGDFRRSVGMVFQDPYDALNPRMRVGTLLSEPLDIQRLESPEERRERVLAMLERVHLVPASAYVAKYPHELSGGERQRVAIGRALMLDPELLIADEPTTMLDVSVRSGLLNLIRQARRESNLAILLISHDFSTLAYVCDRLVIMYLGQILEMGPTSHVLAKRLHPYTQTLCAAIPVADPSTNRKRIKTALDISVTPVAGCPFEPRCALREPRCREERPPLVELAPGHKVACHVVAGTPKGEMVNDP
jgi:peptide/nickel transport system ATP-binding protein